MVCLKVRAARPTVRSMALPPEALDDVGRALGLGDDLHRSGMQVRLDPHPSTGRPTATLRQPDGTVRVLSLALLVDPDALRLALLGALDGPPG